MSSPLALYSKNSVPIKTTVPFFKATNSWGFRRLRIGLMLMQALARNSPPGPTAFMTTERL